MCTTILSFSFFSFFSLAVASSRFSTMGRSGNRFNGAETIRCGFRQSLWLNHGYCHRLGVSCGNPAVVEPSPPESIVILSRVGCIRVKTNRCLFSKFPFSRVMAWLHYCLSCNRSTSPPRGIPDEERGIEWFVRLRALDEVDEIAHVERHDSAVYQQKTIATACNYWQKLVRNEEKASEGT